MRKPTELSLASPQGPVLHLEPLEPAGSQATFRAGPQAAPSACAPAGFGPRPGLRTSGLWPAGGTAYGRGYGPRAATARPGLRSTARLGRAGRRGLARPPITREWETNS